jgi:hypothetical protein
MVHLAGGRLATVGLPVDVVGRGTARYGVVRWGEVWCYEVGQATVWSGEVRYGEVWSGLVGFGSAW